MEEISRPIVERKSRPQEQLNCPRCNSTNTKFCYYNNYSLTQPRYFCKTCRRYWTEGGSLRNVPVGGGSRKNKRSSSASATSATSAASSATSISNKLPDLNPHSISQFSTQNPKVLEGQDLNLAFPAMQESQALELIRTGIASRGLNSFIPAPMPDSNALYSSGFPMQEFKQTLSFGVEGFGVGNRYEGVQENGGKINFFPLGELKQFSSTTQNEADHQNKGHAVNSSATNTNTTAGGFWSGMFNGGGGGGGSW